MTWRWTALVLVVAVLGCEQVPSMPSDDGATTTSATSGGDSSSCEDCIEPQCFDVGPHVQCIAEIDDATVLVAAPSLFNAAIENGAYIPVGSPACDVVAPWDAVECYEVVSQGGALACVGELGGVLFPGDDPCEQFDMNYTLVRGLPLWPVDPTDFAGYPKVPWPG